MMTTMLQFDKAATNALSELQEMTGLNPSQCLNYGLSLLFLATKERENGRVLALMDERTHSYKPVDLPVARQVRDAAA